jgi:putative ABC transport system substrate-binding protein
MKIRRIRRREFMAVLGGLVSWPAVVRAQSSNDRVARVAYLGPTSPSALDPRQIEQFKHGLVENGLVEGRNITVDYLWAEGSLVRLQQLASELARRNLDVIVTAGGQAVGALVAADVKTPIVFAILGDPIGNGIVEAWRTQVRT